MAESERNERRTSRAGDRRRRRRRLPRPAAGDLLGGEDRDGRRRGSRGDRAGLRGAAAPRRRPGSHGGDGRHRRPAARRQGDRHRRRRSRVPVGDATLGRIFNLLGEPIDNGEPIEAGERWPIHRPAPEASDLAPTQEILETGIKVIDLLAPYAKGGKVGLFGGAGRRQDRADPGADPHASPRSTRGSPPSAASASARARATTSGSR